MSEAKITISGTDLASDAFAKVKQAVKDMGLAGTETGEAMHNALSRIQTDAKELASEMRAFGSVSATIGAGLTATITAPIVGMGAAALKASIDFESAFAGVKKTVSGTPAELQAINQQFRDMATVTPVSAVGLAQIGEMAGQLGVHKDQIVGFTKTIVDISTATHLTADEAGSSFARLANVMKMPQEQFSNLGSAVVALGNFGASTEQEMMNMGQRIAAAGSTAGMSAAQVLGIANALSSVGIEAESGGTAMSRVINKISMDVASGGGKLETFAKISGKSAQDFKTAWKDDAGAAFSDFLQGLAQARSRGGDELLGLIHELGFDTNVRLVNAFMSAANAGDLMKDSIALGSKAFKENTELTRAAEERYKTTANQLNILRNNATEVAMKIGDVLLPKLNDLVTGIKPLVGHLHDAAQGFKDLPEPVKTTTIVMAGLAAAAGPLLVVAGGLAFGIAQISTALVAVPALGNAAAAAFGVMTTGMTGMLVTAAGITGAIAAVGSLSYAATRLVDVMSGGKLTGWISSTADMKLKAEEAAAGADTLRLASERSGHAVTTMAEALAINTDWQKKHAAAAMDAAQAATAFVGPHQTASAAVQTLAGKVKALTEAQRDDIASKVKQGEGMKAIAAETGIAIEIVSAYLKQQHLATAGQKEWKKALEDYNSVGADHRATLDAMSGAMVEGIKWDLARGVSQGAIQKIYGATADQMKAIIAIQKQDIEIGKELQANRATVAKAAEQIFTDRAKAIEAALHAEQDAYLSNMHTERTLEAEHADSVRKLSLGTFEYQRAKLTDWVNDEERKLNYSQKNWGDAYRAIHVTAADKLQQIVQSEKAALAEMKASEDNWSNGFQKIFAGLPQLLQQAFTGGGGLSGFGKALESGLGVLAGQQLITGPLTSMFNKTAPALLNSFGMTMTTAIGGAIPLIGPAIGALAPMFISGIKKLFGGVSEDVLKARDTVASFETQLASTLTAQQKTEAGNVTWKMTVIALRDAYIATGKSEVEAMAAAEALWASSKNGAAGAKAAIDQVNAVLNEGKKDQADLDAATKKYKFSIEELGPAMQRQQLSQQAAGLENDFRLLVGSGMAVKTVLEHMSDSINAFLHDAQKTGSEVPAEMKPILEKMIEMGTLTDANGNKITDLGSSGITFSETMTQGFSRIVDKLTELINKIADTTGALNGIPRKVTTEIETFHTDIYQEQRSGGGEQSFANEGFDIARPTRAIVGDNPLQSESVLHDATVKDIVRASRAASGGGAPTTRALEERFDALQTMLKRQGEQFASLITALPISIQSAIMASGGRL